MPSEEQAQAKWQEIAALAEKLVNRSGIEDGYSISPGSALAGDDARCQPYHASHAVKTNITAAVDHLHALCVLVLNSGFMHLAAPATVARGALECASTAVWIASPSSRDERISRTLRWNATDVKDGDKAATGFGVPVPTPLQDRYDKIEAVANKRSLPFNVIKRGYTSTEAVTAAEDYLKPTLGVVFPWRLASGFAHGRRWAMLAYADTMEKKATSDPNVVNLKMENDYGKLLYLGWAAAVVVKGAVRLYEQRGAAP